MLLAIETGVIATRSKCNPCISFAKLWFPVLANSVCAYGRNGSLLLNLYRCSLPYRER